MSKMTYDITTGEGQKRMMYESVGLTFERRVINTATTGDYGADPIGDGSFRMVPSGDIVDFAERTKRLSH
jgi:hypothetical protein